MHRTWPVVLLLAPVLTGASDPPAPTRAAPLYALPADGTWVEYDWQEEGPGRGGPSGTLRLSSVGTTIVKGRAHRWVEIARETRKAGQVQVQRRTRKLLVDEKPLALGRPLSECADRAYEKLDDGGVISLSRDRLRVFTGLGIQGPQEELRQLSAGDEVPTPLGVFRTRHVTSRGSTAGRALEYHGWLSPDLPFGWARMEIREPAGEGPPRLVFRATARRMGQSARSELDESRAR